MVVSRAVLQTAATRANTPPLASLAACRSIHRTAWTSGQGRKAGRRGSFELGIGHAPGRGAAASEKQDGQQVRGGNECGSAVVCVSAHVYEYEYTDLDSDDDDHVDDVANSGSVSAARSNEGTPCMLIARHSPHLLVGFSLGGRVVEPMIHAVAEHPTLVLVEVDPRVHLDRDRLTCGEASQQGSRSSKHKTIRHKRCRSAEASESSSVQTQGSSISAVDTRTGPGVLPIIASPH